MMYVVRISHYAAAGKAPQLRAALEEHSKASNAAGASYNVTQSMFVREPAFINGLRYDSLAAYEAYQASIPNDAARAARVAKINENTARPNTLELFEVLAPRQGGGSANYNLRVTFHPVLGKGLELRKVLEERAHTPSKGSIGAALSTQVAPEDGATFTLTVAFTNLAGLEEMRKTNPADPSFQAFQAKIATLCSRLPHQVLNRVIMPFPSR